MNLAPLDLNSEMMRPWRDESGSPKAKNHIVSDAADQTIVCRMVAAHHYQKEGWVGWSSLTYGGTAQYANTMALYYDWTMQLHRWLSFSTAWHLGLMGQLLLAAFGMFLLLQGRSISFRWACCGAIAYAANSQFITWIYHRWTLGSFCWVPWILWAIHKYSGGKRCFWLFAPIFIGMAFLGGTLQHAALVILAVTAAWTEEAMQTERRAAPQMRLFGRYLTWGFLGLGLAAMMFLPCIDAFLKSNELGLHTGLHGKAENGIYPHGWLQPLFNLASYPLQAFPSVLGRCDSIDVLKLFKSELFYVAYFGSLPVIIALLAPWMKNSPRIARLLIGFGLLLPLTPLVRFLYQRLFLLFILGGIIAFTHFMETAERELRLRVFRVTAQLAGVGVILWILLSIALTFQAGPLAMLREKIVSQGAGSSFGFFSAWMEARADRFIHDLFIWSPQHLFPLFLLVVALVGLRLTASSLQTSRNRGAWLVLLAVIAEVTLFGSRWVVWTDPARHPLFPETPEVTALREMVGHDGRVSTVIHPTGHMACTPFIPNTLSPYGIATISGYDSIVPNGMMLPNESTGDAEVLGRAGVSHLITWPGNPDVAAQWKSVWSSPSMALYENTVAFPRYLAFQDDATKNAFFGGSRPDFVSVKESSGRENSRLLDVPAGAEWIRIAENEDDGWEFRTNASSKWSAVERAPDASMLFRNPNPSQPAKIEMRYNPPARRWGFWISTASLAVLLITYLWIMRGSRVNYSCKELLH